MINPVTAPAASLPAAGQLTPAEKALTTMLLVTVVGYLVLGRTFAYIGVPGIPVFVGELVLVTCLVAAPTRRRFERALRDLSRPGHWHVLSVLLVAVVVVGAVTAVRGIVTGSDVMRALMSLPFNYYPLFLVVGLWWGAVDRQALRRCTLWLARASAVYGTVYVLLLSRVPATFPGQTDVPLFGNGNSAGLAILGIVLHHRARREAGVLLALNTFVLLGLQQRSEWLGCALGLLALCLLTRQVKSFLQATAAVVGLLTVVSLLGLTIPGAEGRGGEVSLQGVVGRSVAPVAPQLAARFVDDSEVYTATASWRTTWWAGIWTSAREDAVTGALGHGYGYELFVLGENVPASTRTPHNAFFYALGYSGWLGVMIVGSLWALIASRLWMVRRLAGENFGLVLGVFALSLGMFGNWFETPFGALPTYLMLGLALAASQGVDGLTAKRMQPSRRRPRGESVLAPV